MPSLIRFIFNSWKISLWLIIGGFVMSWFIWRDCCSNIGSYLWIGTFTATMWLTLWLGNAYLSDLLNNYFSWHKEPVKRLLIGLAAMVAYTLSSVYILISIFRDILGLNLGDRIEGTFVSTVSITLVITMFMTGRAFLLNWRQSAIDTERLQKENVKAQYESLKNQVNPHFLFNSLNALTNLVYQDQDKAAKFIKQLSEVYRYVLESREKELVPSQEELKFLHSYIFLQQIRFGDKLIVDVKMENMHGQIAPLALQLLTENAIKHNIIAEDQPLTIKIYLAEGMIVVENNSQKKSVLTEESSGIGLENIRKRYEFLSDTKVRITETNSIFKVEIPIIA